MILYGRDAETQVIGSLLAGARENRSGVVIVRGDAGVGKTALLDHAAAQAADLTVLRATGIETEAELPFAGLHLVLRPLLDQLGKLPTRQADALLRAFSLAEEGSSGSDDRFLVGLAVLSLVCEASPLLCLVDDAHWLDTASAEALLFAARRLEAEGVVFVFAARDEPRLFPARGLPDIVLAPLADDEAARLLDSRLPRLNPVLRDRALAEAAGNPLALTELAVALRDGGPGALPEPGGTAPLPVPQRVQRAFAEQIAALGELARLVLLLTAAEATGDLPLVMAAARQFGAGPADLAPAERAGLITSAPPRLAFRHPLIRAAAYYAAPLERRYAAHHALAAALAGPGGDADRRAWHLAAAANGPDDDVAAELERAAERARRRGGYGAVAAGYERAAQLTQDPEARARRLLAADTAANDAGSQDRALELAGQAGGLSADPLLRAELARLRALNYRADLRESLPALVAAASAIEENHPRRAAELYTTAMNRATAAGTDFESLARQILARLSELPLDGMRPVDLAVLQQVRFEVGAAGAERPDTRGYIAAVRADPGGLSPYERVRAAGFAFRMGDHEALLDISAVFVADCRSLGMAGWLPGALQGLMMAQILTGDWPGARASGAEGLRLAADMSQANRAAFLAGLMGMLCALEGDEDGCRSWLDEHERYGGPASQRRAMAAGNVGLLYLGSAQFGIALALLEERERERQGELGDITFNSHPDLVEAAARGGAPELAARAEAVFRAWAEHTGQPWALAVAARCQALIVPATEAGKHYERAVRLHEGSGRPFEQARTRLLFGEWLRRDRQRAAAREQLTAALDTFEALGAKTWADRTRVELRATGLAATRVRQPGLLAALTPQELQIVRRAAAGESNRDIAAQLFLSHRTVGYHLYKAFPKLGIASRQELAALFGLKTIFNERTGVSRSRTTVPTR
jgi:DNA-binding CsgD family transcriptional regulator